MQIENGYNMSKRSFFYLSKLYPEGFVKGRKYTELLKTISINIVAYNEFKKDHCHSVFRLKDEENNDAYYRDVMEIHFLELSKIAIDQIEDESLLDWLRFIKTEEDRVVKALSEKNKDIYKASKKLEELSSDEEIRSLAENRAKYLSDYATDTHGYYEDGRKDGLEEGLKEGEVKGIKKSLKKLVKLIDVNEDELEVLIQAIDETDDLEKLLELEDLFLEGEKDKIYKLLGV